MAEIDKGVTESRFYMWRAVFAIAHADGQVVTDEENLMNNYLRHVPFSAKQHAQLRHDMKEAQEIGAMLAKVTAPEDQSEFFQFAQLMATCDHHFDEAEQTVLQKHLQKQLEKFNLDHLHSYTSNFHKEATTRRAKAEDAWERDAENKVGLGAMIKAFFS